MINQYLGLGRTLYGLFSFNDTSNSLDLVKQLHEPIPWQSTKVMDLVKTLYEPFSHDNKSKT